MPQEELEAWDYYSRYAQLANDTLNTILGIERKAGAFYLMDDTMQVLHLTQKAHAMYMKYGFHKQAVRVFPVLIYQYLERGNFGKAKELMDYYEAGCHIFDQERNVDKGNELYYEFKGQYYLGMNEPDSAEYFYRKLIKTPAYSYEVQKGLLAVHLQKNNVDSIIRYAKLAEEALLQRMSARQTNAVIQSSALYNYERHQNIAKQKEQEARRLHQLNALFTAVIIILTMSGYIWYNHGKQKSLKQELEYHRLVDEHTQMLTEYRSLDDKQKQLINSYRTEIQEKEENLLSEEIVTLFQQMGQNKLNGRLPNKREWRLFVNTYKRYLPHMYARMEVSRLSEQELHVSMLSHLGASPSEMALLLSTSSTTISNAKSEANRKMFGHKGAVLLVPNLKKYAYFE